MLLGPAEIVIIIAAIGIFFFGGKKVKDWAKDIGTAKKEFNNAQKETNPIKETIAGTPITK